MKTQRLKTIVLVASLLAAFIASTLQAETSVKSILTVSEAKIAQAVSSQQRIDSIADQTEKLLTNFKLVNKQIAGLRVYNTQLEKQIANQLDVLVQLQVLV